MITSIYNHERMMNDVNNGAYMVEHADDWVVNTEREVVQGIYEHIPLPNGQERTVRVGESRYIHTYSVNLANDKIKIDGRVFQVQDDLGYSIKIMKTKIKAVNGAKGLLNFLTTFQNKCTDDWEKKILRNTKECRF